MNFEDFYSVLNDTKQLRNSLYFKLKYNALTHSNSLEGSTFTTDTFQILIEKNYVKGGHTLDDIQESINSFYTFDLMYSDIGKPLTLQLLLEYHSSLFKDTTLYKLGLSGKFKMQGNEILGTDFDTCSPEFVRETLQELIDWFNGLAKPKLDDIARFHINFERIHPFQDGNGRIGRLIFIKQLLENRLPLKIIEDDNRDSYKLSLESLDGFTNYINELNDFRVKSKRLWDSGYKSTMELF